MTGELHPEIVGDGYCEPLLNGIQAGDPADSEELPGTKVLILSAHSDPEYVERALKEGASVMS